MPDRMSAVVESAGFLGGSHDHNRAQHHHIKQPGLMVVPYISQALCSTAGPTHHGVAIDIPASTCTHSLVWPKRE
jgi:hypothetical protein